MYNDQVNKISNVMESRDGLECYDRKAAQLPSFRVSQVDLLQAWKLLLQSNKYFRYFWTDQYTFSLYT